MTRRKAITRVMTGLGALACGGVAKAIGKENGLASSIQIPWTLEEMAIVEDDVGTGRLLVFQGTYSLRIPANHNLPAFPPPPAVQPGCVRDRYRLQCRNDSDGGMTYHLKTIDRPHRHDIGTA